MKLLHVSPFRFTQLELGRHFIHYIPHPLLRIPIMLNDDIITRQDDNYSTIASSHSIKTTTLIHITTQPISIFYSNPKDSIYQSDEYSSRHNNFIHIAQKISDDIKKNFISYTVSSHAIFLFAADLVFFLVSQFFLSFIL